MFSQREPSAENLRPYLVERKYSNGTTTPLEIDVVVGKNHFKLDVGPAVEIVEEHMSPMGR